MRLFETLWDKNSCEMSNFFIFSWLQAAYDESHKPNIWKESLSSYFRIYSENAESEHTANR